MLSGSNGYILVGADNHGEPTGDVQNQELFDPAMLLARGNSQDHEPRICSDAIATILGYGKRVQ